MAASYDKAVLVGNLGADPKVNTTGSGKSICTVNVATNRYVGKGDEREEVTTWIPVVLRGQFADFAGNYTTKGAKVLVEGFHQENRWTDNDNNEHRRLELVATEFKLLDSRSAE